MKKISIIMVAFAMVLSMTQCKKNEATNQYETVTITLTVKHNNGAKVDVNPATGTVDFETGDKVYVGSGGKYVGFLTHNGTNFVGNITNPTEGQPLQFYFLGNVTPQETLSAGTTEECSVIISDQTEHLPVISCAPSFENYVSGVTAYTGHLLNKCALVKFNVTTPSNSPICITGMKNKVTVDFSQNTVTPSMDGEGVIKLPAGGGENVEKWAILLPQEALEEGEEGSAFSFDGNYRGTRPVIPVISINGYLINGINVSIVTDNAIPIGAINGLFTINSDGDQVYFSRGNLQYQASTNTWRFAENQWDYVGTQNPSIGEPGGDIAGSDNALISSTYNGWIDLFGWGTSGYNHGADCYQPWSTSLTNSDYHAYGQYIYNLYDQTGQADWGYNSISNGGNQEGQWRTLTGHSWGEWYYVCNKRNTSSDIRYAKAQVAGVNGVILLPDDWSTSTYSLSNANTYEASFSSNVISASQWATLENAGAVFLPAAGIRSGASVLSVGLDGNYWTASVFAFGGSDYGAYCVDFHSPLGSDRGTSRDSGLSVRLVCPAQK